ncbi:DNA polymerase III subunit delta' [Saxibacter everestensis]|uniref:DNA polymerase III subunit delta n=1 Tax=Saxibacter everestensis TaxID=2909229 RepID=A0ABY8QPZ8_9MICO|nr:DNA polymerase III subunit delta' [Brevibacteriaceae bacterium ZFBP1038]
MSVWDDLVGQDRVIDTLKSAAAAAAQATPGSAMTHAWLFTGPPGSGRSNAARAFAAALLCGDHGESESAERATVLSGTHADVTVVATEKVTISIDEVRGLVQEAQRSPAGGKWRIIIIEDADRMAERTSNVLLKAIEEPPARTVWLLCAPSPADVVTTIRSRCRALTLRVPPPEAVAELLVRKYGVDPGLARESSLAAQSHIGRARRLATDEVSRGHRDSNIRLPGAIGSVGQAILAAGELVERSAAESKALTEERSAQERAELLRSLGAESGQTLPPALRAQVRQLEEDQKRRATRAQRDVLDRAMVDLLSLYRDVLMVQLGAGEELMNIGYTSQVHEMARTSTPNATLGRLDALATARRRLKTNTSPLLAMEALTLSLR